MSPACRGSMVVIPPFGGGCAGRCAQTADHLGEKCRKWGVVGEVDYALSRWALAWRLRAGVLFLVLVRTPTFRLCSNERQPKNQHNLAYKPHIRRCKRYFAGIAARAGRWHNKTARRSARREVERATGIEPASEAWEASILPMNYARNSSSQRNRPVDHSLTADGRATGASRPTIRHAPAESFWPRAPQAGPPLTVERQVQRAHPPARRSPLPPSPCPRPSAPVRRCPARIH